MSEDEIKQLAENAIPANGLIDKMDWKGYINQLKIQWIDGYKAALASITHLEDEDHVFEVTDSEGNKSGVYFYNDNNGFNQHSKLYETKELALKAYRESIVTPSLQSGVEEAAIQYWEKHPHLDMDICCDIFTSGAEWQAQVKPVIQWVKVSERQPEFEGDYYVVRTNLLKEVMYHTGSKTSNSRWRENVIEWLEETPTTNQ